ncbi:MAG: Rrf2 family transcriptional regulator [Lachnospiraceae bacterium]|nr:Rrf2 family transcriptional regulator [Lachnospiraceae bacterium]
MIVSTRGRYALLIMLDLATNNTGVPVRIKDISVRQGISEKYLEKIIAHLNRAGLVKSIRGSKGGYLLKNEPFKYTVGMILKVADGELSAVSYDDDESFQREAGISKIWEQLEDAVNGVVDNITLQDLIKWQEESKK